MKISDELLETVKSNPHIQEIYFTRDKGYCLNKHEHKGKYYSSLKLDFQQAGGIIHPDPAKEIVKTLTRNEILETIQIENNVK